MKSGKSFSQQMMERKSRPETSILHQTLKIPLADQLNFVHMLDPHIFNSMEFNIDLCLIQPSGQTVNFCKK